MDKIRLRILIADDESGAATLTGAMLTPFKAEITTASNGREALELLTRASETESPYDLLITDIDMPVMRGDELVATLRERSIPIPILAITGTGDKQLLVRLMRSGVTEYLDKPFSVQDLRERVSTILEKVQAAHEQKQLAEDQHWRVVSMKHELEQYEQHFSEIRSQVDFAISTYRSLTEIRDGIPGLQCAIQSLPYRDLGGDFCAVNPMPHGFDFLLVDVAGHDMGASYIAVLIKAFFEENRKIGKNGEDFFLALNSALASNGSGRMCCAVFLRVDNEQQSFEVTCASHPAPIFVAKDFTIPATMVETTGTPLGFDAPLSFDTSKLSFSPGDRLVLYTDGVSTLTRVDGMSGQRTILGSDGLRALIEAERHLPLTEMMEMTSVKALSFARHRLADDLMIIGLELSGEPHVQH